MKRQALELYLEGLGFRSIGCVLGFSNVTILDWVRAFGEQLDAMKNEEPVQVVEMDEMHSYVGSKKPMLDRQIAVDRLRTGLHRGTVTGEKLWQSS